MTHNTLLSELTALFQAKKHQLYVSAIAITRDRAAAEDAVADALLAISQLQQPPDDLAAYFFRTVRNKAMHSSKARSRFCDETEIDSFVDVHSQSPQQKIFVREVLMQLEELPAEHQQVLIMKLFGDLTFKEIALITASNSNTVASWYRRGLASLKEMIHEPAL